MNEHDSLSLGERILNSRLGWALGNIALSGAIGFGVDEVMKTFNSAPVPPWFAAAAGALGGAASIPMRIRVENRE